VAVIDASRPAMVALSDASGAVGSGVIVEQPGIIATNAHLIDGSAITVVLEDGRRLSWETLAQSNEDDLAVGRVAAEELTALTLRSTPAQLGEPVIALGNPFGLGITASLGIISADGEAIRHPGRIQTDAAINPGNSGGALVDRNGRLVGIVNARAAFGTGVGFAVSAERLRVLLDTLPPRH
jgi:S1-C subfamily serine protease